MVDVRAARPNTPLYHLSDLVIQTIYKGCRGLCLIVVGANQRPNNGKPLCGIKDIKTKTRGPVVASVDTSGVGAGTGCR